MAGAIAAPVARSQITVVSRWLVIPIAAICEDFAPALRIADRITDSALAQISSGSCSTQPDAG
jgi:hypothetical protein